MTDDRFATLVLLLGRLERLNESFVADVCRRHGVLASDARVLAVLRHLGAGAPVRPTEIGRIVVQTPGGLTATLGRLERQGHVARVADAADGRSRRVELTASGIATYDAVLADLLERYSLAFGGIDTEAALAAVHALVSAFERFGNLPPSEHWALVSELAQ